MHASTFNLRWWRLPHVGRNELVRGVDRAETAILIVAAVLVMVTVPVAGMYGAASYATNSDQSATELATRHPVTATVRGTGPSSPLRPTVSGVANVPVTWTDGTVSGRGIVAVPSTTGIGERVTVWLDNRGVVVPAPLTGKQAVSDAVLSAIWVWVVLAGATLVLFLAARWGVDRVRAARWEREWRLLDTPRSHNDKR